MTVVFIYCSMCFDLLYFSAEAPKPAAGGEAAQRKSARLSGQPAEKQVAAAAGAPGEEAHHDVIVIEDSDAGPSGDHAEQPRPGTSKEGAPPQPGTSGAAPPAKARYQKILFYRHSFIS